MGKNTNEIDYASADVEVKYYDMLYDFTGVITKANEQSFEGYTPKQIAGKLRKAAPAFCNLCMIDSVEYKPEEKKAAPINLVEEKQKTSTDDGEQLVTSMDEKETELLSERPKMGNFLQIKNGWGLCPVCSAKVLRVTMTTRLENFPVYCKRCRAEHLVNWWNAEHQRIEYKRYTNDSHLRNQALKGTGLRNFQNNRSSATERVAIKYSGS